MSPRQLPARPDIDHLKAEARALRAAFTRGDAEAVARVHAALGPRTALQLSDAQRVVAHEYGFPTWVALRAYVREAAGREQARDAFFAAIERRDLELAREILRTRPRLAAESIHVAAALGQENELRRLLEADPASARRASGDGGAEPLVWLCISPFHHDRADRDRGLEACARALLEAGADPNVTHGTYGLPALYWVTGERNVPAIARMLLEAGANPNDGESAFHAAERFHEEALDVLLEFGADLNRTGEWGNTPLYFLLRFHDVASEETVRRGFDWLLEHGADPNVRCGRERETSLHVAVRRAQSAGIVRALLDRDADVHARRGDGRTAWVLARRAGLDDVTAVLEQAGAEDEPLFPPDMLMAACARGDDRTARRLAGNDLVAHLSAEDLSLLPAAAARGRIDVVRACLAARFPPSAADEFGATALHRAAIEGRAAIVRELLGHGADVRAVDDEHESSPLGWAIFGADVVRAPGGDYAGCVTALLGAGAEPSPDDFHTRDQEILGILRAHTVTLRS